ncbi:SLBB domain-containing protein [Geochorda subterranea]|uniref:SLBB domain-containing protein n=1 Tax=Geochorda subterranea TaxID=3109564 RepID=A0ABZ1BQG2_9FIRM|nr:SLBB domain-containing protein [Limnochorda sp. LNt]WRP14873.1 SLBB domain-containing protein [Limnochorda sp. LNt]
MNPSRAAVWAVLLCLLLGAWGAAGWAQSAQPYRLGPGDVLEISVWGQPDLRAVVEVRPDGYVSFPLAGDVLAEGVSPAELAQSITERLEGYIRSPQVTVIVQRFRTIRVQALGAVRQPGTYALPPGATVTQLLGAAAGLTEEADPSGAVLSRRTASGAIQQHPVDVEGLLDGRVGEVWALQDGDVLFVPRGRPALVIGEVRQPGAYMVRPGMRVLDLLAAAGGLTPQAAGEAATLTRATPDGRQEVLPLDLPELLRRPDSAHNVAVRAGDLLVVPTAGHLAVLGEVRRPGTVRHRSGMTVSEALAEAGGPTDEADLHRVWLVRGGADGLVGEGGRAELDLAGLHGAGEGRQAPSDPAAVAAPRLAVQPGDILVVPRAQRDVVVLGAVARPGTYPLRSGARLLDALAAAGGVVHERAGEELTVRRQGRSEPLRVSVRQLVEQGDPAAVNVALEPGDVIFVPEVERQVAVVGEVLRPGSVPYRAGMTVADVLAQVGGLTERADPARASIHRLSGTGESQPLPVDLRAMAGAEGWSQAAVSVAVQPGDILVVPRAQRDVVVLGAVVRPGTYPLRSGARLLDALAAAGGVVHERAGEELTVRRQDRSEPLRVSVRQLVEQGDPAVNVTLEPGDVIFVPEVERQVLALGALLSPGAFPYREGLRVLDLLARAGGPRPDADERAAVLNRAGGESVAIDLALLQRQPRSELNVALAPGDVLFVPPSRQVLVLGEVGRPGAYSVPAGARVTDVLALAGGVRPDAGVTTLILTRRSGADGADGAVLRLDYARLVEGADAALNVEVEGGDVLYVPEGRRHVLVLGQVQRPGLYAIPTPGPVRLLDVLALAGGPTRRAVLDAVGILRPDGQSTTVTTGRGSTLFQGRAADNPVIEPGDVVYVPETRWPDWSQILGVLEGIYLFQQIVGGS